MAENNQVPLIDRTSLEEQFSGYEPSSSSNTIPVVPFKELSNPIPNVGERENNSSPLTDLENSIFSTPHNDKLAGGSIPRSLAEVSSNRFSSFTPGDYNNEDAYGQGQGWVSKMVSGVGKGLLLTGTTFLQTTVGAVNGLAKWAETGKASSFYNNDFNKWVDEINKKAEDALPNYYTDREKNANWYSPSYLLTGNFLWDGIVKNLGFSAGAALSGMAFAGALRSIPIVSKLFSIGKAAEALAATEEGLLGAEKVAETYGKVKNLSDRFLGSFKILNPGGRAVIAGLSTSGEASFEAYQNLNQFRNKKIQEYKDSNGGAEPTGADLDKINRYADEVGNVSYLSNVALLSVTNYIQFPKILGSSYTAEKGMINDLTKNISSIVKEGEKYVISPSKLPKLLSTINKIRPYTFSASEGFEEGAQYVIQEGTQDYYNKALNNKPTDFLNSLYKGIGETLGTNEGMKNVLMGGLSGAIMLGRGRYRESSEEQRNTEAALGSGKWNNTGINSANLSDFTKETISSINRGTVLQEERENDLKNDDILDSKDKEADYIINYLSPRIKYGRFDLVKSDINDYKSLANTDEGFAQLQAEGKALPSDTREAYLERLINLENTADNVKSLYQSLHLRYGAKVDEKGELMYTPEVMDKMIYAASKVADYDQRISKLSTPLLFIGIDVNSITKDLLVGNPDSFNKAVDTIKTMDILDEEKTSLGQTLDDIAEISLRRNKFLKEYTNIKSNPIKYQKVKEPTSSPEVDENGQPIPKETIIVKTKTGEKEVTTGEEYYMGDVVGKDGTVRWPRLKILGKNNDGTIKIQDVNGGSPRNISADELESYRLAKVADVDKSENSRWYFRNIIKQPNTTVTWNTGKDKAGKVPGVIRYDSKTDSLQFVYNANWNKPNKPVNSRFIKIGIDQFEAKGDYKQGMFALDRPQSDEDIKEDNKDIQSRKDSGKIITDQRDRRGDRLNILNNLYDELSVKQKNTEKLISQKKVEIENIRKELSSLEDIITNAKVDGRIKKAFNFKSNVRKALADSMRLSRMKEQFEQEVTDLEAQKEELDNTLAYIEDTEQNLDELPTGSFDFLDELKDQISLLEDSGKETTKQITAIHKLIDSIEKAIDSNMTILHDFVNEFKQKYPKTPLAIMGQEWIDFLQTNPNFLKLKPNFKEDLKTLEDLIAQTEEFEIKPNEEKITDLKNKIVDLQQVLKDTEKELIGKESILDRFEKIAKEAKEIKKQQDEEERINKDVELQKKALGTNKESGVQTEVFDNKYSPIKSKDLDILTRSTTTAGNRPHAIRSNKFGIELNTFPNKDKIRGIHINVNNEKLLFPDGIIDEIIKDIPFTVKVKPKREDFILLVATDGNEHLVDISGNVIPDDANKFENAIWQTLPNKELLMSEDYDNASMIRKGTPEEIKNYILAEYAKKRDTLSNLTDLSSSHPIDASFGHPQLVTETIEINKEQVTRPVYSTRTSVEDAHLIEKSSDLLNKRVIRIETINPEAEKGTVTYKNAIGKTLFELSNGLTPLNNRQFTDNEADNIYQAIYHLSKEMIKGNFDSDISKNIFNYLKSIVYWGIPTKQNGERKEAGYNSIFWEKDETTGRFMLSMSGLGKNFVFTPLSLEQNKSAIINLLKGMYHNINSSMIQSIDKSYDQPITFNDDGTFSKRTWVNYQSYLLSKTFLAADKDDVNNGKARSDIPLTTLMRPLLNKEDVNREGVYFFTTDNVDDIDLTKAPKKEILRPITPIITPPSLTNIVYKLGDNTRNIFTDGNNNKIEFVARTDVNEENYKEAIGVLKTNDFDKVAKEYKEKNQTLDDLKKSIFESIKSQINTESPTESYEIQDSDINPEMKVRYNNAQKAKDDDNTYTIPERLVTGNINNITLENWNNIEKFLKNKIPNFPTYRLKNIINVPNGRQAYGMFKNGAIYVWKNAEIGTFYHEVFEGVYKHFVTPEEKISIENEFNNREGEFFDRTLEKNIKYKDATPGQISDRLAEEFREYIHEGKIPNRPDKGRPFIHKMFIDLVNFIKTLFVGKDAQSNTEQLFEKINKGGFKNYGEETSLAYGKTGIIDIENAFADNNSEFRLTVSDKQRSEVIQEISYQLLKTLTKTDEGLFTDINNLNKTDFYTKMQDSILDTIAIRQGYNETSTLKLMNDVNNEWNSIINRHQEYLKGYGVKFDENDELALNDEEKTKDTPFGDPTKIDGFRKMGVAMRLLLSTIPKLDSESRMLRSSIGGTVLLPVSQVHISLLNNLHTSRDVPDMINKLREMTEGDSNYKTLFQRITKSSLLNKGIDLSGIKNTYGARLLTSFWYTFNKMMPTVKNIFVYENGEVAVSDASLSTVASQLRDDYNSTMTLSAREGRGFYKYNETEKLYTLTDEIGKIKPFDTLTSYTAFLNRIGINFTVPELQSLTTQENGKYLKQFKDAVNAIKTSMKENPKIKTFNGTILRINNRLLDLGEIKARIENPEVDSTFFMDGKRTQSYIGTNAAYTLYNNLSQIEKFDEAHLDKANLRYLKTDVFSQGSNLLSRMFDGDGVPRPGRDNYLKVGWAGNYTDYNTGKTKTSSRLLFNERLIQEINLNLKGWYFNLVPGDSAMPHMTYLGNAISTDDISSGMTTVNNIFREYFKSEVNLSREKDRPVAKDKDGKDKYNKKELRFFKSILGDTLHNKIMNNTEEDINKLYTDYEKEITDALNTHINTLTERYRNILETYKVLEKEENGYIMNGVALPNNMGENEINRQLKTLIVNYEINNIELHKVFYGDPYQFTKELRRIKNFHSPREGLINNSPEVNELFDRIWNKGYEKGDIGNTNFNQDWFRSATHKDVFAVIKLLGYDVPYAESDGSAIMMFKAYRQFRIRVNSWNEECEKQFRYDIAWEKEDKSKGLTDKQIEKRGLKLSDEEYNILSKGNPKIQEAYVPQKPIVSGNRLSEDGTSNNINDTLLDKDAIYPLSYRMMKELNPKANILKLYNKMQKENTDYMAFESARKVGARDTHESYNENGGFNETPYSKENIINVPFSIMSVQTEVPSKKGSSITRGSQVTGEITMDLMDAGVPVDFLPDKDINTRIKSWNSFRDKTSPIYDEIKNNQTLLKESIRIGLQRVFKRLGIKYENKEYSIPDLNPIYKTLRNELLTREVNNNVSAALQGFIDGTSVLEATPVGLQIKQILCSIVDKEVVSQKINGMMPVQIPSTFFEENRIKGTTINGKQGWTSDVLRFYEDENGKRVCQIMVRRWFKSDKTDEELLEYFNKTPEGQKILSGLAFRIPTQDHNSIDSIQIAKFLPQEFGDAVVIPSALVVKTGSDFDVDKLSMYLKNVYEDIDHNIRLVQHQGTEQTTKDFFDKVYSEKIEKQIDRLSEKTELTYSILSKLATIPEISFISPKPILTQEEYDYYSKNIDGIYNIIAQAENRELSPSEYIITQGWHKTAKLNAKLLNEQMREDYVEDMYKRALENEYIQSCQNLVSLKENFARLIAPNSSKELEDIANDIAVKTAGESFSYDDVGKMLDRTFMSRLRHAFITCKAMIPISAVNQKNHAWNQRQSITINPDLLENSSVEDQYWLTGGTMNKEDAILKFANFNKVNVNGRDIATLSMIKNSEGKDISNINSQFINAFVDSANGPYAVQLGLAPNTVSTHLLLIKAGVDLKNVEYFMNQPIIRDYLRNLESIGYTWLFNNNALTRMQDGSKYTPDGEHGYWMDEIEKIKLIPNKEVLYNNIGKEKFTQQEKIEQQFILVEFLKYAKMAAQHFLTVQATNFDTANLNNPWLIWKKFKQMERAQQTMIDNPSSILENSFLGDLADAEGQFKEALYTILTSEQATVSPVLKKVLEPYVNMNDDDFTTLAQKATNDIFDYAVQTADDGILSKAVADVMTKNGGTAREVMDFIRKIKSDPTHELYKNIVINLIKYDPSDRTNTNNIKIKGKDVNDQNNIIGAFKELKDYLEDEGSTLYKRIKTLAVIQSGLSNSPVSFTSILPYEDLVDEYNNVLSSMDSRPLGEFASLHVFERTNYNNDDITPYMKARWTQNKKYNPSMRFLPDIVKNAVRNNNIPPVMTVLSKTREANSSHVVFSWEKQDELLTPEEVKQNLTSAEIYKIIKQRKVEMRKQGDFSYIQKGLFQKVYDGNTSLIHIGFDGKTSYFVYKAINAWGDSFRANEFYTTAHKSVIDNGFIKVDETIDDNIVKLFNNVEEVKTKKIESATNKISLKDGYTYSKDMINSEMLEKMGYTSEERGKILKSIC